MQGQASGHRENETAPPQRGTSKAKGASRITRQSGSGAPSGPPERNPARKLTRSVTTATLRVENGKLLEIVRELQKDRCVALPRHPRAG